MINVRYYDSPQPYREMWERQHALFDAMVNSKREGLMPGELLFKQIKQNFPLRYIYGESANAIKLQIWVTLIANLLLMVMQKGLKRQWSFSGLATMVRITLMYYVDFHCLFNNPEKELLLSAKLFLKD